MNEEQERARNVERMLHSPSYRVAYKDVDFLTRPSCAPRGWNSSCSSRNWPSRSTTSARRSSSSAARGSSSRPPRRRSSAGAGAAGRHARRRPPAAGAGPGRAAGRQSRYYELAREFARLVSREARSEDSGDYVIFTGGGPGIMEAANRGAYDRGQSRSA